MASKNDKWSLFKNYLHNELGITKEDIREWLEEAVNGTTQKETPVNKDGISW